jgi:hypothetical protein
VLRYDRYSIASTAWCDGFNMLHRVPRMNVSSVKSLCYHMSFRIVGS